MGLPPEGSRHQVPLAPYTTLGLGGPAATWTQAGDEAALLAAVRAADGHGEPVFVLGGGSNVVIADAGFPGTVVRVATRGLSFRPAGDATALTVAAGENWDDVVARCVAEGLAGLECLSGIPGLAGATPIQNVGAYGQEVADTITTVRVYDRENCRVTEIPAAACGFGYRTSFFKRTPLAAGSATGRFVVLAVSFRLTPGSRSGPIRYPELAAELGVAAGDRVPLGEARAAVLKLRARKGMVLDAGDPDTRSAGSFFTNPVLTGPEFAALLAVARRAAGPSTDVPHFPAGDGQVKVPAAWLIEHAGFGKGHQGPAASGPAGPGPAGPGPAGPAVDGRHQAGAARISSKHTLALINPGEASTASLLALAAQIRAGVHGAFGVTLDIEPVLVGTGA